MNDARGNLEDLVADVRRRAEQRGLAIEATAEARARAVEAEGAARTDAARTEARAACAARTAEQRRQQLARADLDHRRRRLDAREAHLERVWQEAAAALTALAAGPGGDAARAALARDAARRLGAAEATVVLDPDAFARLGDDDVAAWSEPGGPRLRKAPAPLARGHGARVQAGRASVDATFEGRLERAREVLRGRVAALLGDAAAAAAASEDAPSEAGAP